MRAWTDDGNADLVVIRHAFAKQILAIVGVTDPLVEEAFATVSREHFLGEGPWQLLNLSNGVYVTPSVDPIFLYTNDLVVIDKKRDINNGEPSLHARLIACAMPVQGDHVVHIGAGVGYYSAIMAYMVGLSGRLTAIEREPDLAARTRANFGDAANIQTVNGDGTTAEFDIANVIYVSAGASLIPNVFLDRLADGGRLVLPLTSRNGIGAIFLVTRIGNLYGAKWISSVRIFPCIGGRDEPSEIALAAALASGGMQRVTRLYRDCPPPPNRCWLRGQGWCLAYE